MRTIIVNDVNEYPPGMRATDGAPGKQTAARALAEATARPPRTERCRNAAEVLAYETRAQRPASKELTATAGQVLSAATRRIGGGK